MNLGGQVGAMDATMPRTGTADPGGLAETLLEHFPGDVLIVDTLGDVIAGRSNLGSGQSPVGRPLWEALGLCESDDAVARLQVWLASIAGTDEGGWALHLDEPPAAMPRADGSVLALEYVPLYQAGTVERVLILVTAPARHADAVAHDGINALADEVDPAAVSTFLVEARGYLSECDAARERLALDAEARHAINHIFRALHTLKGTARAVGLRAIEEHAHAAEDELHQLRELGRAVEPEEVGRIEELLRELRAMVEELDDAGPIEAAPDESLVGDIIGALERCRTVIDRPADERESAASALALAVGALGSRPLRALEAAVGRVGVALRDRGDVGAAVDGFDSVLFRIGELATELGRSPLPGHFVEECDALLEALDQAFEAWHRNPDDPRTIRSLWRATEAARAAATSFKVPIIATIAESALAHLSTEERDPGPITAALVELTARLDELHALGPLAPQRKNVDILAVFHDEARKLLSQMQRALLVWSQRLRDGAPLELLYELTHMYAACVRRYRIPGLKAHVGEILELLHVALESARPQRRLVARVEKWLDELDEHLRLYCTFMVEMHSAPGGREFVAQAVTRLREAHPARDEMLRELAAEAEEIGILTLCATLREGTPDALARVERLLSDAPSFVVAPPDRIQARTGDDRAAELDDAIRSLDQALAADRVALPPTSAAAYAQLRRRILGLTRVPLSELNGRLTVLAADVAAELGKAVRLRFEGCDPLLDEPRRRKVSEILVHAVRNAIDHGIERPADRRSAGKPDQGTIAIATAEAPGQVRITVRDDGRGVHRDRISARAVERGLVTPEQVAEMTSAEIDALLFLPGFSTADRVTSISGRGVGMDAIKIAAEELGGSVILESTPGAGTSLGIVLPH